MQRSRWGAGDQRDFCSKIFDVIVNFEILAELQVSQQTEIQKETFSSLFHKICDARGHKCRLDPPVSGDGHSYKLQLVLGLE